MVLKSLFWFIFFFLVLDIIFGQWLILSNEIWLFFRRVVKCSLKYCILIDCGVLLFNDIGWFVGIEIFVFEVVLSEIFFDEIFNFVVEQFDELISKQEVVIKVVKDIVICKKIIKEVSEKFLKRKIIYDMVLEEQYKVLLLKQSNLKFNKKKFELEIVLLE